MTRQSPNEPIAIVGSGCRFPGGVNSPSKLWETLREPRDLLRRIPTGSRFNPDGWYHENPQHGGTTNVKHAFLLEENIREFDAQFFNINAVEAAGIDPQQRLLLETTYEAVEAAGLTIEGLRGSDTGVYVGLMCNDYDLAGARDLQSLPMYHATGVAPSIASNRISYFYDWHGPSMTVDTACSSSLVAMHAAVQALRSGDSRVALACGTNLLLGPERYISESNLKMLSPAGRSRMWDESVDGYGRGEGIAAVVLKKLSDALADGDSIDCVIREIDVNHDGRSQGITMPRASAQTALIRQTYAKAGLDATKAQDRCDYFESHGTGTPAGDPIEAEAVYNAFFGEGQKTEDERTEEPLYIGSIKSVIGHTESTAGLAGVIKVAWAMKHGYIPPNLLFHSLNPRIRPFYGPLQVPTELTPWPKLAPGQPRRASVNSFGFGGTNAHVIIESFQGAHEEANGSSSPVALRPLLHTPIPFSAHTKQSLAQNLSVMARYLRKHPQTSLSDLAYTLQTRRSQLPERVTIPPVSSVDEFREALVTKATQLKESTNVMTAREAPADGTKPKIMAIFTGQGAQYARMAAELLEGSGGDDDDDDDHGYADKLTRKVEAILDQLDLSLAELDEADRPTWKIRHELQLGPDRSRINEAALAQPLCTAVQIVLVELLRLAKVEFACVVGHSSGEIGAAYASGRLNARDAIRIAYYRGLFAHLAASGGDGQEGKKSGAMLAAGLSFDDAEDLCAEEQFQGRLVVAAHNAPSSVTLSGDEDAVAEVKTRLDAEGTFAQQLKVDKAYHSHHMEACSPAYLEALRRCEIRTLLHDKDDNSRSRLPLWFSSVRPGSDPEDSMNAGLEGPYWNENLVSPVLFMDAVDNAQSAFAAGIDAIIEIGPHPALKRPVLSTFKEVSDQPIDPLYIPTLQRNTSARHSLSAALGSLWAGLRGGAVDLDAYENAMRPAASPPPRHCPNLVPYQWTHNREYWHESPISRNQRLRSTPAHSLLGELSPECGMGTSMKEFRPHRLSWRNILRTSEHPWIQHHKVQGITIFPAAGYLTTALEAVPFITGGKPHRVTELRDFRILQPLVFSGSDSAVPVYVAVESIDRSQGGRERGTITARFTYSTWSEDNSSSSSSYASESPSILSLVASGDMVIHMGEGIEDELPLPDTSEWAANVMSLESETFYNHAELAGYGYTGPFRSLSKLSRKFGKASADVDMIPRHGDDQSQDNAENSSQWAIHPAALDCALQVLLLAKSYPGDGELASLYLPSKIGSIRFNSTFARAGHGWRGGDRAGVYAALEKRNGAGRAVEIGEQIDGQGAALFQGSFDMVDAEGQHTTLQARDVVLLPLQRPTAENDKQPFASVQWVPVDVDLTTMPTPIPSDQDTRLNDLTEYAAAFYLSRLVQQFPPGHEARREKSGGYFYNHYLHWASHVIDSIAHGSHPRLRQERMFENYDQMMEAYEESGLGQLPASVLTHIAGDNIARAIRGEVSMVEKLVMKREWELLYETQCIGIADAVGEAARQIVDVFPQAKFLEVGAGTGGATKQIMARVGRNFDSYHYTDISSGFFGEARKTFQSVVEKMQFGVLNLDDDFDETKFTKGSYDVAVGMLVVHAAKSVESSLRRIRSLLKPGGRIILGEFVNKHVVSTNFTYGCLEGWWAGVHEGRIMGALMSTDEWDQVLRRAGFSGIDTASPCGDGLISQGQAIVSQALDDRISFIRQPLSAEPTIGAESRELVIVGGVTHDTLALTKDIKNLVKSHFTSITTYPSLEEMDTTKIDQKCTILLSSELDAPLFKNLTPPRFNKMKELLSSPRTILWATEDRLTGSNPYAEMAMGMIRSLRWEVPGLRVQFFDLESTSPLPRAKALAEALLRICIAEPWKQVQSAAAAAAVNGTDEQKENSVTAGQDDDGHAENGKRHDIMWQVESQYVSRSDGRIYVPRMKRVDAVNTRLNAQSRRVTVDVDTLVGAVQLENSTMRYLDLVETAMPSGDVIRVSHSSPYGIRTSSGFFHVIAGKKGSSSPSSSSSSASTTSEYYIGLASSPIASTMSLSDIKGLTPCPSGVSVVHLVEMAIARMLSQAITGRRSSDDHMTIVVHAAKPSLMSALEADAEKETEPSKKIIFTTSSVFDAKADDRLVHVSPWMEPAQVAQRLLSLSSSSSSFTAKFVDMSATVNDADERLSVPRLVFEALGGVGRCEYEDMVSLISSSSSSSSSLSSPSPTLTTNDMDGYNFMKQLIADFRNSAHLLSDSATTGVVSIKELSSAPINCQSILSWIGDTSDGNHRRGTKIPASVRPLNTRFQPDRTYWLAGFTGSLGLALCEWMVAQGARHVALTSRNPKIDPIWSRGLRARGAEIYVGSCDVSDFDAVKRTYDDMCKTMPSIGGVVHGAMVLQDSPIWDMSYDKAMNVIRPKVDGSIHLDRLFHDTPLDFFVFLSSAFSVVGNPGQSMYGASNLFMHCLARQRRERGLAASCVGLPIVMGVGYVMQQMPSDADIRRLEKRGVGSISEPNFYHFIAEAILAGRPESSSPFEIWHASGLSTKYSDSNRPPWYPDPEYAFLVDSAGSSTQTATKSTGQVPLNVRLADATSKKQVNLIIFDCLREELRSLLEFDQDQQVTPFTRTDELGVDSLVAAKLRTWLSTSFNLNISTLEILQGTSLQQLMGRILEAIPSSAIPNVSSADDEGVGDDVDATGDSSPYTGSSSDPLEQGGYESSIDTPDKSIKGEEEKDVLDADMKPQRAPVVRTVPLSSTQTMFWFVHTLLDDRFTLNSTWCFRIKGRLEESRMARAVQTLGQRHEILRTCFEEDEENEGYEGDENQSKTTPVQRVLEYSALELETYELESEDEVQSYFDALNSHEFDLGLGSTIRIQLLNIKGRNDAVDNQKEREACQFLLIGYHHIVFDGASHLPMMLDLERVYNWESPTPLRVLQFADFSQQQKQFHASGAWDAKIAFWRRQFPTTPEPLPIHRSRLRERRVLSRYENASTEIITIDSHLHAQLGALARSQRVTMLHIYMAAFKVLLSRFLGISDLCIGLADDGRRDDENLRSPIGPFLNILPIRLSAKPTETLARAAQGARDKILSALQHAEVPLEVLYNELRVKRPATHSPLFQAFLNYLPTGVHGAASTFCDQEMLLHHTSPAILPFDVTLNMLQSPAGVSFILATQAQLYSRQDANVLARSFLHILGEFASTPKAKVGSGWRPHPQDVAEALSLGRGPTMSLSSEERSSAKTLVHLIEEQSTSVELAGKTALVGDTLSTATSYSAMMASVNKISARLLELGVPVGSRVCVFQQPSLSWVESLLAILKIGAVYVPLDPTIPVARLALIASDCQPSAILVDHDKETIMRGEMMRDMKHESGRGPIVVNVTDILQGQEAGHVQDGNHVLPIRATLSAPAIMLYTSGSTGTPKGVIISHANLSDSFDPRRLSHLRRQPCARDTILHQTAYSFDLSIMQVFFALRVGATLAVASESTRADSTLIANMIRDVGVTVTLATPTEYKTWLRDDNWPALRHSPISLAMSAGEAISSSLVQLFRRIGIKHLTFQNHYGPTETTCGSTAIDIHYTHTDADEINNSQKMGVYPAGPALANEMIYILDSDGRTLQPIGLPGEVYIGGSGVAAGGYLNRPDQTKTSFVADPFAASDPEYLARGWTTMYRTGDRGRLVPPQNGETTASLELEGRIGGDTQVKIHGIRIDLCEIEETILREASVGVLEDVVATIRSTDPGNEDSPKFIVAHVTFSTSSSQNSGDGIIQNRDEFLRDLRDKLPLSRQMRPAALVPVETLPRTTSGKLDRRAAAKLDVSTQLLSGGQNRKGQTTSGGQAALSDSEVAMLNIWNKVIPGALLSMHQITSDSDFFAVGGNSLMLIEVSKRIKQHLGKPVPLIQLYHHITLRGMVELLEDHDDKTSTGSQEATIYDWEVEARPDEPAELDKFHKLILSSSSSSTSSNSNNPPSEPTARGPTKTGRVVLTGATGFLGRSLLTTLLAQDEIKEVICIGIRSPSSSLNLLSLCPEGKKITCHQGDLRLPRLGLSPSTALDIFLNIDAVIHNAADVSHLKTYASLKRTNVDAVRELSRLCLLSSILKPEETRTTRGSPVPIPAMHFISTAGVTMYSSSSSGVAREQRSYRDSPPPGGDGSYGYLAAKHVAEGYLEGMNARYGLPVWIHRPSSVVRPSEPPSSAAMMIGDDGKEQGKEHGGGKLSFSEIGATGVDDITQNLVGYCRKIGAVPDLFAGGMKGWFDFVLPGSFAELVVRDVMVGSSSMTAGHEDTAAPAPASVRYRFETGDLEVRIEDLRGCLERERKEGRGGGEGIDVLGMEEWVAKCVESGLPEAMAAVFRNFEAVGLAFPRLVRD